LCASCPAGSLAWASDRAGPGWLGPAQPMWAELDPAPKKTKKIKKTEKIKMCMHE